MLNIETVSLFSIWARDSKEEKRRKKDFRLISVWQLIIRLAFSACSLRYTKPYLVKHMSSASLVAFYPHKLRITLPVRPYPRVTSCPCHAARPTRATHAPSWLASLFGHLHVSRTFVSASFAPHYVKRQTAVTQSCILRRFDPHKISRLWQFFQVVDAPHADLLLVQNQQKLSYSD